MPSKPDQINKDYFSPDILQFIQLLNEHEVKYLLVGGNAVIYFGHSRLTADTNFFYDPDTENCGRLFKALYVFWQGDIPGIADSSELAGDNHISVDIEGAGQKIPMIGLQELIINKKASNRPNDLEDIEFLKKLQ